MESRLVLGLSDREAYCARVTEPGSSRSGEAPSIHCPELLTRLDGFVYNESTMITAPALGQGQFFLCYNKLRWKIMVKKKE